MKKNYIKPQIEQTILTSGVWCTTDPSTTNSKIDPTPSLAPRKNVF